VKGIGGNLEVTGGRLRGIGELVFECTHDSECPESLVIVTL
jgi:hypothetical protein